MKEIFKAEKYFSEGNGGVNFEFKVMNNSDDETYLIFALETSHFAQTKSRTEFQLTKLGLETLMECLTKVYNKFPEDSKEKEFICDDRSKRIKIEGNNEGSNNGASIEIL